MPEGHLRQGGRDHPGQLRAGQDHLLRLRGGVDPAHQRRADHRHLRPAPAPARQHGPTGRGHHGPARARLHPGLHRCANALPLHPRLHAAPLGPRQARHAGGLAARLDPAAELLGQHAEVHGVLPQVDVRRGGHARERLRLRLAPPDPRRPLPPGDVRRHGRRAREGHALHRPEPGHLAPREPRAQGAGAPGVAGGQGQLAHRDRQLLEERAGDQERQGQASGYPDRGVLLPVLADRRVRGDVHQYPAHAAVPLEGRRPSRRLPLGPVVHPSARQAPQEALRAQHGPARRGLQEPAVGLRPRAGQAQRRHGGGAGQPQDHEGGLRVPDRRSQQAPRRVRRAQGRRLHHVRLVDLLRGLSRPGQVPARAAGGGPGRSARRPAHVGLGVAGQPPHHVQPRLGRSQGSALERAEEVGVVGR